MDLSTTYLGFRLPHPFMPGASPMIDDMDVVRRLEDAGAAAIVMHSLFEEGIEDEELAGGSGDEESGESRSEALLYLTEAASMPVGPEDYLEMLRRIKDAVDVPVIASLNGNSLGGWLEFARLIEQAGADALELNVYDLAIDADESSELIERRTLHMVGCVKEEVALPVAVKLSPFYTSFAHFARHLDSIGADGLILFNRFYQADVDVEKLQVARTLHLSDRSELLLRLRWIAALAGHVDCSLAVTGGVHTAEDAAKAILCGAHAVQVVSALLERGPEYLAVLRQGLANWLDRHGVESLSEVSASMSLLRYPDPRAYERANYLRVLQSWREEQFQKSMKEGG